MIDLRQGDCLELLKDIPDGSVDMILADPPYGTTHNVWDKVIPVNEMWAALKRIIKPSGAILLFAQNPFAADLIHGNRKEFRYEWVCEKSNAVGFLNANRMPMRAHETVLTFYRCLPTYRPQKTAGELYHKDGNNRATGSYGAYDPNKRKSNGEMRFPRDVIRYNNAIRTGYHTTAKPADLLEYFIRTYTIPGETVLDFCMGSGSTGVACVNTCRNFIGMELDPGYFETARKRIEDAQKVVEA